MPSLQAKPTLTWETTVTHGEVWPEKLAPGQKVGLFAPAHRFDPQEMERGVRVLRSWGLKVKKPEGLGRCFRYLAGDDSYRLAQLTELMMDDEVGALVAVRGGYGCQRLLPGLDKLWPLWPAKPIFGYSDLTALHLARYQASGVIGFHGPMVASLGKLNLADQPEAASVADFRRTLTLGGQSGLWTFRVATGLKEGQANGPLLGGNLTLVTALLASPWLPNMDGAILMLEEVDEKPYRLDRLLTTLRHSPVWRKAQGLVFGSFTGCGPPAEVRRLLREAAADFDGPVVESAPFGHGSDNRLFPIGAWGRLEV